MKETMSPDSTNTVLKLEPATKRCWKCETTKVVGYFSKDKSRPDGLQPVCKDCAKVARKAYLEAHPDAQKKAWSKWYANPENAKAHTMRGVRASAARAQMLIERFKSQPCMDCKQSFPTCCMDFDHRPGTEKVFELGYRAMRCRPVDVLMDEIAKCDLVCANCHRIRTVSRNQVGRG